MRPLFALIALLVAAIAHSQVVSCDGASTGQPYSSCGAPSVNASPVGSTPVLWCSSGAQTGAAQDSCPGATWLPWSNRQGYSWILTSYAGWQRAQDITFNQATPAPPATRPPP